MSIDLPTAGRFEGHDHLLPVRVYYEDTDFTGLVYHANYVRYFERGRSDFLRLAGVGHADLLEQDEPLALQIVEALPGARGANVMVAPLETAAESMVPVMEAQALSGGAGNPENSPITAATAWFM